MLKTDTVGCKLEGESRVMAGPSLGLPPPLPLVPPPCPHRVNVGCGPAEERVLLTGLHAVADIHCENCKTTLGWKYVSTEESGWWREDHEGGSREPHVRRKLSMALGDCLRPGPEAELRALPGTLLFATLILPYFPIVPSSCSFLHTRP